MLQIYVYGEIINGAVNFIMRLEISSHPRVFVVFNDNNYFSFLRRDILPTYFCKGSTCIVSINLISCMIFGILILY